MAVPPPTGPFPPNDGSNIFRRGVPKPTAKPAPPSDDPTPAEPAEELDLDDEDALFGSTSPSQIDELDAALSGVLLDDRADDDQPVSAVLLDDVPEPADEPVSAELLDDALADAHPVPPSAADSSIFTGGPLPHTGVGSGWLDPSASGVRGGGEPASGDIWTGPLPTDLPPPAEPPTTSKFSDAADLFAELRGDSPASDSVWVESEADAAENTGRVSESEVRRALDTARPLDDDPESDLHMTPTSMAEFDLDDEAADAELIGGKGDAIEFDDRLAGPEASGSSIFDPLDGSQTEVMSAADDIDFDIPVPTDPSHASSVSGRLGAVPDDDPEAVAADLFGSDSAVGVDEVFEAEAVEAEAVDVTDDRTPALAAAVAAGALGGVAAAPAAKSSAPVKDKPRASAKVPPPPKRTEPEDDEEDGKPTPKGAKKGGIGGVLAGLATGLALGVGGFAIVYMTGLIPNDKKPAVVSVPPPAADPQQDAKFDQLKGDLAAANEKAEQATADLDKANEALTTARGALTSAKRDATDAKKALTDANKATTDALAAVEPLKKDVDAAKKEATDAKKDLLTAQKDATDAKAALDGAKKDATEAMRLAADADAKRVDAEKKLKAADDSVALVVKELKANKLLDDKDDVTKLPEGLRKLAAMSASGDAKKAAEALTAALKERDDAKAALTKAEADVKTAVAKAEADAKVKLTKAEADAKAATDAAAKAKTDADKLVADAMKAADDKLKAAVDDATKDLKKQAADATAAAKKAQDDLTAAKATAKADAEAAAKAKVDEANAKVVAAEKALDTKVKALEAEYAAKLAEARTGAVKLVPAEMEASEKASRSYADGLAAYRGGRYSAAEAAFATATQTNPADARYWYYLGLARTQTGTTGADDAFKKGAQMEAINKPSVREIDAALERLSFADKQRVNKYR